jgi:peroxiredoxin
MMKALALSLGAAFASASALAAPAIDAAAPAFSALTSSGQTITLEQFKGKPVVLEWTNDGCPFVQKQYGSGAMQKAQREVDAAGGVWLTVISSAPGKQGYADAERANQLTASREAKPDYVVLDPSGEIGKAYAAKTTPHMFVIDQAGVLRYAGAIDDDPTTKHTKPQVRTFALDAFNSLVKGEPIEVSQTQPYGCSVKYGS